MGIRTGILLIVVLLITALAALNWGTLSAFTAVSLGFLQIEAPLGLIMLGLTALLGLFFLIYLIYLQGSVLMDGRRINKELATQRELADKSEASRIADLRSFLEGQENKHMGQNAERHAALLTRIEQLERALRERAELTDNALAAHLGQLEDRLERQSPGSSPS